MNKEFILELADKIESLKPKDGFSMEDFYHDCGTPSCIAGWALHMAGKEVDLSSCDFNKCQDNARDLLDISESDATILFYAENAQIRRITQKEAATALRKLVETGKADWTHAESYFY